MTSQPDTYEVVASDLSEGTLVEFDGNRYELMSVKTRGTRLALRLSDGTTRMVSATRLVTVIG